MCENMNRNPFAGLFSDLNDAVSLSQSSTTAVDCAEQPTEKDTVSQKSELENHNEIETTDTLLSDVFGITLKSDYHGQYQKQLVFVEADTIEDAVFERLMLTDLKSKLIPASATNGCQNHTLQKNIISYLFESFSRLQTYNKKESERLVEKLRALTLRNAATALQEPELFPGRKVHAQFISLFEEGTPSPALASFMDGIIAEMSCDGSESDEVVIRSAFGPVLDVLQGEADKSNLFTFRQYWFQILEKFASREALAKLVIQHSTPKTNNGRAYADTLLGALLSISCLPKTTNGSFDYFNKPLQQPGSMMDGNIWTALDALTESLHQVFHSLLKCSPEVRHLTLQWIGNCLDGNARRGKLWNAHIDRLTGGALTVSDGFMLNVGAVLLKLCQPFCARLGDSKIFKIDPTYCAAEASSEKESRRTGMHMRGINSETCLIPTPEGEKRACAECFGFTTECFYLTHRALDLGFRVVVDKLLRVNQDVARLQRLYSEAQNDGPGSPSVLDVVVQRMESKMAEYMSLRASLLVPEMLNLLSKFHATTSFWLVQVNLNGDANENDDANIAATNYAPNKFVEVTFPMPDKVPTTLRCIPEFIVENTVGFLCFLRRLSPNTFEEQGANLLNSILTEIIVLMDSPRRLYNPHLRARLAEGLEALLPSYDEAGSEVQSSLGTSHREMLFIEHPHRNQIVRNLLKVFVSIETTGESVQFEQKFNYRRPMYNVMEYLWKLDEYRSNFKELAREAEQNMEAVEPPLFLRFINLLMNDAVFLLDEALSHMAQLKQAHEKRERGEWDQLPQQERDQQASEVQHIGMIARFNNILGRKTITMLKMLTTEIKSIFCHSTMVDRIASMLNYLLLQLVGPNQRNLKVKDRNEYDFNPANLVLNICEIYINLSRNKDFMLAVSQDGRSYKPELFKLAENVLVRIGGVGILSDLDKFAKRVEEIKDAKEEEDEILNNAPDNFLDPIMSTLMVDPVILPSSRITVDRQTIARHLLSDQTDPFNRSPLTMDKIKSNTELRNQIEEWIRNKKLEEPQARAQSSALGQTE